MNNWERYNNGDSALKTPKADVKLTFDSNARRWTLRIYKSESILGRVVTYEVVFHERYAPSHEEAVSLADKILEVELLES